MEEDKTYIEEELLGVTEKELTKIYKYKVDKLPTKSSIYLPTDRIGIIDKIIGVQRVDNIYKNELDSIYGPKIRELKEKYKDIQRCFLIGNGPSLNRTDLSVLKNEVTFAVNGFFLKTDDIGWTPTFYMVEDHLVAEDRAYWINRMRGPIKLFPAYLGYVLTSGKDVIYYNHRPRKSYPDGFDFSLEADKITYTGCTVTFSMMQMAAYLGFKEIYLIGVDANYSIPKDRQLNDKYGVGVIDMTSDDPNHFDKNYFGKGFRWHDPQVNKMVEAYKEAEKTLKKTNQRIYNATIGGCLEVFERKSYAEIFKQAMSENDVERSLAEINKYKHPKVLILDTTATANGTATGEIKANLFAEWPKERFLQIASEGSKFAIVNKKKNNKFETNLIEQKEVNKVIVDFDPEIIIYRPVPNSIWLHEFALECINKLNRPLITWIMDDWPKTIGELSNKSVVNIKLLKELEMLIKKSVKGLSICSAMTREYAKRYKKEFIPIANGINPIDWDSYQHHEENRLLVRYGGGLAKNMSLESVISVANTIEELAQEGHYIRMEINTHSWWYKNSEKIFANLKYTSIDCIERSPEEYREWLSKADATSTYNFDEETRRYVQYSFANKLPECLASKRY